MTDATPPTDPYQSSPQPLSPSDERLWSTLIPALIGYLVLKDRGPFVRSHTLTALNFQLTMLIAYVIGSVLTFILIGFLVLAAVGIVVLIFSIIAAIAANKGENYKYPLTIEFIK
jgi:uncharacterized Tic20 family protein